MEKTRRLRSTPVCSASIRQDTAAPLRARVTFLGRLVGDVLRAHARAGTFEHVERLQALTRSRRSERVEHGDVAIDAVLDVLDVADAVDVIRAFNLYFQMVNLAEQLHRERRRRDRALHGGEPLRGSLETLAPGAAAALDRLEIGLVFTAHPTEVLRSFSRTSRRAASCWNGTWTRSKRCRRGCRRTRCAAVSRRS